MSDGWESNSPSAFLFSFGFGRQAKKSLRALALWVRANLTSANNILMTRCLVLVVLYETTGEVREFRSRLLASAD